MRIESVSGETVITCRGSDSLRIAAQLMCEHDTGCLVVTADGDEATSLEGFVTIRDVCTTLLLNEGSPDALCVRDAMSERVEMLAASRVVEEAGAIQAARCEGGPLLMLRNDAGAILAFFAPVPRHPSIADGDAGAPDPSRFEVDALPA